MRQWRGARRRQRRVEGQCKGVEGRQRGGQVRLDVLKCGGESVQDDEKALNGNVDALKGYGEALKCDGETFKDSEKVLKSAEEALKGNGLKGQVRCILVC